MTINIGSLKNIYPEHRHGFYEIIIYTAGTGYLKTDKGDLPFRPGTIIIVPPNTLHTSHAEGSFERIFINGSFNWLPMLTSPVSIAEDRGDDGILLAKLAYKNRYKSSDYLASLLNAFTSFIVEAIEVDDKMEATVKAVANELSERFHDSTLDPTEILNKSGYSEDYIRAEFKRKMGKSPIKFLTEIRISHAKLLIDMYKSAIPLAEIAEKCGFTDYVYFSRRFKEIAGCSPRGYANSK